MASKELWIIGGLVAAGVAVIVMGSKKPGEPHDVQIDPNFGAHRGLAPIYGGIPDQTPTRMASSQDPKGGPADYLGYDYGATTPSAYAKGEPAQMAGRWWDKAEDRWAPVNIEGNVRSGIGGLNYGKPPLRIPKLFKDAIRYWDGITSYGGTDVVGQKVHLFHLRPSQPTRGYRSISGSLASIGGGQSTASRARIPAVFVPSSVS